jgi:hypothetical protein
MTATVTLHPAMFRRHSISAIHAHFSRLGYTVLASGRIERTQVVPMADVEKEWRSWRSRLTNMMGERK